MDDWYIHVVAYLSTRKNRSSDVRVVESVAKRKRTRLRRIRNSALINGFSILPRVWLTLDMDMGYQFI